MKKFIVIVLDGFGIGEMDDVRVTRPQDIIQIHVFIF